MSTAGCLKNMLTRWGSSPTEKWKNNPEDMKAMDDYVAQFAVSGNVARGDERYASSGQRLQRFRAPVDPAKLSDRKYLVPKKLIQRAAPQTGWNERFLKRHRERHAAPGVWLAHPRRACVRRAKLSAIGTFGLYREYRQRSGRACVPALG